jgi:hypothetical protein
LNGVYEDVVFNLKMNLELKQNIWKSDKNGLGFYCVNVIESSTNNPNLSELLQSEILKENEFGDVKSMNKSSKDDSNHYGAFLMDKINQSDFEKFDFNGLKDKIAEYWTDEDWGADLPIFKKNFDLVLSDLNKFELSTRNFYYINAEKTDSKKLTDPNFFTYLVCIISTEKESNKIITLTFGLD